MSIILFHPTCEYCIKFLICPKKQTESETPEIIKCTEFERNRDIDIKFNAPLIASDIGYNQSFVTKGDVIFMYKDGVYIDNGENFIREECQKRLLEGDITIHRKNEVVEYIRDATRLEFNKYVVDLPSHFINFKNGYYDISSGQFLPHDKKYFSVTQIPHLYDPGASCHEICKFLKEIVLDEDYETLLELIGYCFLPEYRIHRAFMFVGSGHNGKSTFIQLLTAILGKENVSDITLQRLCNGERFTSKQLYGKLLNACADLDEKSLKDTGLFKQLTGQDRLFAEGKFKDGFFFVNYAKMVFSCNKVPMAKDDTDAYIERWRIIQFPNKFEDTGDNTKLIHRLTTEDEIQGIISLALLSLQDLLNRGHFIGTLDNDNNRALYKRLSDNISAFIMDYTEETLDPEDYIIKTELYTQYRSFCESHRFKALNDNAFGRKLINDLGFQSSKAIMHNNGDKTNVSVWRCVRMLNNNGNNGDNGGFKQETLNKNT